jgi:OPA family glycerol-3-phosphate transporter-like MFS transporter
LLAVSALDFSSKKAVGTAAGFIGLFGYVGRMTEGKGIGMLAERYGWNVALYAVVVAVVMAIALLSMTWTLSPRNAKIVKQENG